MKLLPQRYRNKITIDPVRGCWLWSGEIAGNGYGRAWFLNRRYAVHRLICFLLGYKINLDDLTKKLDHLCEVRNCCCPRHVELVTQKVNVNRIYRRRKRIDEFEKLIT